MTSTERRKAEKLSMLLQKILKHGSFDLQGLASELLVSEPMLRDYLSGQAPIPFDRQLCLAQLLIEHVPTLQREGHNMLSRLRAEAAYNKSSTVLHQSALPAPFL